MLKLEDLKGYKWVLDMDDTIAYFHKEKDSLQRFSQEKDFFYNLIPSKLLLAIQIAILDKVISPNDIYIISASPNKQADQDKAKWLSKYLQVIPKENIMFSRLGENKADLFIKAHDIKDLSSYILIDDFTKNLLQWQDFNGKVVKYINEYNNTKQSYKSHNIPTMSFE